MSRTNAIADAREDGTLETWKVDEVDGRWIVYRETHSGVAAYACDWPGMTAVANRVESLVRATSATTYRTKSAAVAAVRRAEGQYRSVAVRGDHVFVF
ncbi:MAG: hypothetical protein H6705_16725 [Myxococcales bacterium]|nr:hypothetical protein [Myxococcales bacterium]